MKLLTIALIIAGAASAQLKPSIPLPVTPTWITGSIPAGVFPLTPLPIYTAPTPFYNSTTTRLGAYTYFQDSLGTTGTSTKLGAFTYSNFSNGVQTTSCTSSRLGTMLYTNCF
jgi:hypothetical protein